MMEDKMEMSAWLSLCSLSTMGTTDFLDDCLLSILGDRGTEWLHPSA